MLFLSKAPISDNFVAQPCPRTFRSVRIALSDGPFPLNESAQALTNHEGRTSPHVSYMTRRWKPSAVPRNLGRWLAFRRRSTKDLMNSCHEAK